MVPFFFTAVDEFFLEFEFMAFGSVEKESGGGGWLGWIMVGGSVGGDGGWIGWGFTYGWVGVTIGRMRC